MIDYNLMIQCGIFAFRTDDKITDKALLNSFKHLNESFYRKTGISGNGKSINGIELLKTHIVTELKCIIASDKDNNFYNLIVGKVNINDVHVDNVLSIIQRCDKIPIFNVDIKYNIKFDKKIANIIKCTMDHREVDKTIKLQVGKISVIVQDISRGL